MMTYVSNTNIINYHLRLVNTAQLLLQKFPLWCIFNEMQMENYVPTNNRPLSALSTFKVYFPHQIKGHDK